MTQMTKPEDVIDFWFQQTKPEQWWQKDASFDQLIDSQFSALLQQAIAGELADWRLSAEGRLAEIILLDQFSRNIYRDQPAAFQQDPQALALSQEAIAHGANEKLTGHMKAFLYMPFMHSESKLIQRISISLFAEPELVASFTFAEQHQAIIQRFGRFPHRNAILGRVSTTDELDFLQQPNSAF